MTKYLIVDDEPLAHDLIENFCNHLPHLKLEKHCYDALEALEFLSNSEVDLMFLDLNMPRLKGFEFLRTLKNPPKVIVTTAYKEFALEGFELSIVDYLVKPFSFERFLKAVNKVVIEPKEVESSKDTEQTKYQFFIKGEGKHHQITTSEIYYVEAFGNYAKLFFKSGMIVAHLKISEIEELLPQQKFLRVHRSFIVATEKVSSIHSNRMFIGDYEVPIGQTYIKTVQERLLTN